MDLKVDEVRDVVGRRLNVALSEHERQLMEQLERSLYDNDPAFAQRMQLKNAWFTARREVLWAIAGVGVGLSLMLAFCLTTVVAVGVSGAVVMVISLDRSWSGMQSVVLAKVEQIRSKTTAQRG